MQQTFDVVIPCHHKDFPVLTHCIESVKKFLVGHNRIFIISAIDNKDFLESLGCVFVDEASIPLYRDSLQEMWNEANPSLAHRTNWIYQQMLKLGAPLLIPNLSHNFLCLDSDVVFVRKVDAFSDLPALDLFPFSIAKEYHKPYLETYERLMLEKPKASFSFISHHMMFNKDRLTKLVVDIMIKHGGLDWPIAIIQALDLNQGSTFSEWDLYGNWMMSNYRSKMFHRQMNWLDISRIPTNEEKQQLGLTYDFVAIHAWMRNPTLVDGWLAKGN